MTTLLQLNTSLFCDQAQSSRLDDVDFLYAEGLNLGEDVKASALSNARQQLATLAA